MDRRSFMNKAGRTAWLAGFAFLGAFGVHKRIRVSAADCKQLDYCRGCTLFADCDLPEKVNN